MKLSRGPLAQLLGQGLTSILNFVLAAVCLWLVLQQDVLGLAGFLVLLPKVLNDASSSTQLDAGSLHSSGWFWEIERHDRADILRAKLGRLPGRQDELVRLELSDGSSVLLAESLLLGGARRELWVDTINEWLTTEML